ncbi:MAG: hypothetical protein U9Q38_06430 [Thermodesulfobacteriota bacterium]|nr:hypothetical protein [Thermodesulfobacteriota bacterium]
MNKLTKEEAQIAFDKGYAVDAYLPSLNLWDRCMIVEPTALAGIHIFRYGSTELEVHNEHILYSRTWKYKEKVRKQWK